MPKHDCPSCTCVESEPELLPEFHFGAFWEIWPKKDDKLSAERVWNRLARAERRLAYTDIKNGRYKGVERRYVPNPATYLNRKRWTDEWPTLTIPDPPKPALPDGGLARRPVGAAIVKTPDGRMILSTAEVRTALEREVPRDEALRRFADIKIAMKVKTL